MIERSTYKSRVNAVKPTIVSEGSQCHGCCRVITAAFTDYLLPSIGSESVYQAAEYAAGLRWLTLKDPLKQPVGALEEVIRQTRLPIEGYIMYAKTRKENLPHAFAFMIDGNKSQTDIFSVDTYISHSNWYLTYPSVHDALRVMGLTYREPYSVRAIYDETQRFPTPDDIRRSSQITLYTWNIGAVVLEVPVIDSTS